MRYRIEYLRESTEEESVCLRKDVRGDLDMASWQARMGGADARLRHCADGFQIRDLTDAGRIVALETFDNPLSYFAPHARDQVVH